MEMSCGGATRLHCAFQSCRHTIRLSEMNLKCCSAARMLCLALVFGWCVGGLAAPAPGIQFSKEGGFFEQAFSLGLRSEEKGVAIRYTTDFSEPTGSSGVVYGNP